MGSKNRVLGAAVSILALAAAATAAHATDGYFQNGYGARQKAMAGAGVANGQDATTISLNPAGLVRVGNEWVSSVTLFSPHRETTGSGVPGFTPNATVESENELFPVPNSAMSYRLRGNPFFDVVGYSMYGNGGMNTEYPAVANATCGGFGIAGGTGVFCGGKAGVNLQQMFLSVAGAKSFGNVSVGIAPIIAMQMFEAKGLSAFGTLGASTDPANLSDRGTDLSFGGGLRAGIEWALTPSIRLGLAASTPIWMQKFDRYSGLFAEDGGFDIPASLQAGIAVNVNPSLTLMADYKRIWYSSVDSVGNPSTNLYGCMGGDPTMCLGGSNGPGFGWRDIDIFKIGIEWRTSPELTLRAGYSYNTQPIPSRDVMFNILAPGVMQHHITAGALYQLNKSWSLELAATYAPEASVRGTDLLNPAHNIEISMWQYEITAGLKYRFGGN